MKQAIVMRQIFEPRRLWIASALGWLSGIAGMVILNNDYGGPFFFLFALFFFGGGLIGPLGSVVALIAAVRERRIALFIFASIGFFAGLGGLWGILAVLGNYR